ASSTTSTSIARRRSATASVNPAMPPPTTRTLLPSLTANRRASLGLKLQRLDDFAQAVVVVAHAGAELLRRLLEHLQAAVLQGALDLRIVLHGMDVLRQRSDDARQRCLR